jgi:hypothetical protein
MSSVVRVTLCSRDALANDLDVDQFGSWYTVLIAAEIQCEGGVPFEDA